MSYILGKFIKNYGITLSGQVFPLFSHTNNFSSNYSIACITSSTTFFDWNIFNLCLEKIGVHFHLKGHSIVSKFEK